MISKENLLEKTRMFSKVSKDFQTFVSLPGIKENNNNFISILCSVTEKKGIINKIFPMVNAVGGICIVYSNIIT
jgi:hypothetical protein